MNQRLLFVSIAAASLSTFFLPNLVRAQNSNIRELQQRAPGVTVSEAV